MQKNNRRLLVLILATSWPVLPLFFWAGYLLQKKLETRPPSPPSRTKKILLLIAHVTGALIFTPLYIPFAVGMGVRFIWTHKETLFRTSIAATVTKEDKEHEEIEVN